MVEGLGMSVILCTDIGQRINHACRPNTAYRFNDHTLNFDVFALKPIKPNEELTYICKHPPILFLPSAD
jgi:SET domain-containing protein